MLNIKSVTTMFNTPRVIFTMRGNPISEMGVTEVEKYLYSIGERDVEVRIFDTSEEIRRYFDGGVSPLSAVALFDASGARPTVNRAHHKRFSHLSRSRPEDDMRIPVWTNGAQWVVEVYASHGSMGHQIGAHYVRKFRAQLDAGLYPWGLPRKGEHSPERVELPDGVEKTLERLNAGPDLAANIAHISRAAELPPGSKISWLRVPAEPVSIDLSTLQVCVDALRAFERACGIILRSRPELEEIVLAGVSLPPELQRLYLDSPAERFSVTRPDLHYYGGEGPTSIRASEIDEMPGGLPELAHLDDAYGINQKRWTRAFDWLTGEGRLVFLVSSGWSRVYVEETNWLAEHMRQLGYDAHVVTTDQLPNELVIRDDRVYHQEVPVGTVWRQFPVFECQGMLVDLVRLSHEGGVRMVPEFASFGNKAWFSVFRGHEDEFRRLLYPEQYELLRIILPESHLVLGPESFPISVNGFTIGSIDRLRSLSEDLRDQLVLKVSGANTEAARSYGVLMGHGLGSDVWSDWIEKRLRRGQPFIIQRKFDTSVVRLPVYHTGQGRSESFPCRVLIRPWSVGGEIVSAHGCAVPSNTSRVHGMVDMAVVPFALE
jgi:hypothetical protein